MKARKTFLCGITTVILVSSLNLFAQGGVVSFDNIGAPPDRRIYYEQPPGVANLCSGNQFSIALYWGPQGATDENQLVRVGSSAVFFTGVAAGTFAGGHRTITGPGPTAGAVLTFQARGWETAFGSTWEEVVGGGNPQARFGKGPMFEMKTKDPSNPLELVPSVGDAPGWRGFVIGYEGGWIIPEPSTLALGLLTVPALLLFGRRK